MLNYVIKKIQISMFSFQERTKNPEKQSWFKKKSLHGCFCVTFVCNESGTLKSCFYKLNSAAS